MPVSRDSYRPEQEKPMAAPEFRKAVGNVSRFPLAHLPTPLEPLPFRIADRRVFMKRDDCTGFALGGNKSRKLEYTLAAAKAAGATTLLTASGIQSNHVRQSAAAAVRAGMKFHGIIAPAIDRFPIAHIESGNVLIDSLLGAILHLVPDEGSAQTRMEELAEILRAQGEVPFIIPLGASDGTGSLGYANCAIELLDQCAEQKIDPDCVFVPTGSGGTHGGMLAGLRGMESDVPVVGISVSEPAELKIAKVAASVAGIAGLLGAVLPTIAQSEIIIDDRHTGMGYGHPTGEANHWVRELARRAAILLDPVYTGKAFAGLAAWLESGEATGTGDVVFLHTGGTAALFADPKGIVSPLTDFPDLQSLMGRVQ